MNILTTILIAILLSFSTSIIAIEEDHNQPVVKGNLYSDNKEEILNYLKNNRIPPASEIAATISTAAPPESAYINDVVRALDLFKKGSSDMRLAIAKSLRWAPEKEIIQFWEACGADDIEAKHYLVGIALVNTSNEKKNEFRTWLLNNADMKYASAFIKYLIQIDIFVDASDIEKDNLYKFVKELYKQTSIITSYRDPNNDKQTINVYVKTYAVYLLPKEERSFDILLEWMVADSKTADEGTLGAMWGQWHRFSGKSLKGKEFFEKAAQMPEMAESWLRSPYKTGISEVRISMEASRLFSINVTSQIFNKDDDIREKAIENKLRGISYDSVTYLKNLNVTASQRRQVLADTQKIYEKLEKTERFQNKAFASELDKNYKKLKEALEQ